MATHDKLNILLAMFHNVLKAPTYNMSKISRCSSVFNVVKEKDPKQYFGQKLILIHLIWIYCGIFCITMFIMSIYEFCLHINPENSLRYISPNSCLNFAKLCKSLKKMHLNCTYLPTTTNSIQFFKKYYLLWSNNVC